MARKIKSISELNEDEIAVLAMAIEPLKEIGWKRILKAKNNRILCNGDVASKNGIC